MCEPRICEPGHDAVTFGDLIFDRSSEIREAGSDHPHDLDETFGPRSPAGERQLIVVHEGRGRELSGAVRAGRRSCSITWSFGLGMDMWAERSIDRVRTWPDIDGSEEAREAGVRMIRPPHSSIPAVRAMFEG